MPSLLVLKKASKMRSIFSGAIPVPESCTDNATPLKSKGLDRTRSNRSRSSMLRIELAAFVTILRTTC